MGTTPHWSRRQVSNPRLLTYKDSTLPSELLRRKESLTACCYLTQSLSPLDDTVEIRGGKTRITKGLRVTGLLSLLETLFQSSSSDNLSHKWVEAYTGFEPAQSDWKSEVLPLHKYAIKTA